MGLMYLAKSRKGFSVFSLMSPTFFYLLAAFTVITIAFNINNTLRAEHPVSEEEKEEVVIDETDYDEKALTKAEEKILPKNVLQPELRFEPEPNPEPEPEPEPNPEPEPEP